MYQSDIHTCAQGLGEFAPVARLGHLQHGLSGGPGSGRSFTHGLNTVSFVMPSLSGRNPNGSQTPREV